MEKCGFFKLYYPPASDKIVIIIMKTGEALWTTTIRILLFTMREPPWRPPLSFWGWALFLPCLRFSFRSPLADWPSCLLSKGYGKKMLSQARIGFGCGIASLCTVVFLFTTTFISMVSNPDQLIQIGKQYDAICENMYGQSSEDLLGYSFEDRMRQYADFFN